MSQFTVQKIGEVTVVEFVVPSLMDPIALEESKDTLFKLVDEEDRRRLLLDFEKVQYLSSQAIGIVLGLQKKLSALPRSTMVLCGVGAKLMELLKITRLDKVLKIKPTQQEALKGLTEGAVF